MVFASITNQDYITQKRVIELIFLEVVRVIPKEKKKEIIIINDYEETILRKKIPIKQIYLQPFDII